MTDNRSTPADQPAGPRQSRRSRGGSDAAREAMRASIRRAMGRGDDEPSPDRPPAPPPVAPAPGAGRTAPVPIAARNEVGRPAALSDEERASIREAMRAEMRAAMERMRSRHSEDDPDGDGARAEGTPSGRIPAVDYLPPVTPPTAEPAAAPVAPEPPSVRVPAVDPEPPAPPQAPPPISITPQAVPPAPVAPPQAAPPAPLPPRAAPPLPDRPVGVIPPPAPPSIAASEESGEASRRALREALRAELQAARERTGQMPTGADGVAPAPMTTAASESSTEASVDGRTAERQSRRAARRAAKEERAARKAAEKNRADAAATEAAERAAADERRRAEQAAAQAERDEQRRQAELERQRVEQAAAAERERLQREAQEAERERAAREDAERAEAEAARQAAEEAARQAEQAAAERARQEAEEEEALRQAEEAARRRAAERAAQEAEERAQREAEERARPETEVWARPETPIVTESEPDQGAASDLDQAPPVEASSADEPATLDSGDAAAEDDARRVTPDSTAADGATVVNATSLLALLDVPDSGQHRPLVPSEAAVRREAERWAETRAAWEKAAREEQWALEAARSEAAVRREAEAAARRALEQAVSDPGDGESRLPAVLDHDEAKRRELEEQMRRAAEEAVRREAERWAVARAEWDIRDQVARELAARDAIETAAREAVQREAALRAGGDQQWAAEEESRREAERVAAEAAAEAERAAAEAERLAEAERAAEAAAKAERAERAAEAERAARAAAEAERQTDHREEDGDDPDDDGGTDPPSGDGPGNSPTPSPVARPSDGDRVPIDDAAPPPAVTPPLIPVDPGGDDLPEPWDEPDSIPPRASLSPTERVIPSWTDPTVRRASDLIGGPLGVHASVGRNRVLTPLRVVLVFALAALIVGWLAKSPCIQTGADGGLDQGGQRPWITGCYNDIVPLYGARGLSEPSRNPYSYAWVDHGADQPAGQVYSPDQVRKDGDEWIADLQDESVVVGGGDVIGDQHSGYQRIVDGQLEPLPDDDSVIVKYLEYPVLTGYFTWGAAALTSAYSSLAEKSGLLPVPLDVGAYLTITAILLGLGYLWVVASTVRITRRRIWDAAMLGLSPLLMVHAFTNWDLLAMALTAAGMAAWARGRREPSAGAEGVRSAVLAGVLLGLGAAAKLYPMLLLGPLAVLALRTGQLRRFWYALGAAVGAWILVNAPIALSYPQAWREFFATNASRGPEWDSWYFLSTLIAPTQSWWSTPTAQATTLLNVLSLGLFLVACLAIGWLALAARRRPRFAQLAFLVVVAFLLTNKVFSPQYALWLLPLVVLALPRWRPVIVWQLSEVCVWYLLMLSFDTDAGKNLPIEPFAIAATVRGALLIMLVVMVVKDILHPERDRVRICGDDDPSGGVLDGAADRFTLPSLPVWWRRLRGERRATDAEAEPTAVHDAAARPSESQDAEYA